MRRSRLLPIFALMGSALTGCGLTGQTGPAIEVIACGGLSEEEREWIPASPKDSIVEKITVSVEIRPYIGHGYGEDGVYAAAFNPAGTGSRGEPAVFVSLD
jgi:hypothetical protein